MAHEGYIKLYRQLLDNDLWKDKPFTKGQAWVDLLLKANYADKTCKIKGKMITIKRGQLLRSADQLASDWGWSRGKVMRFLRELERTGNSTANGTAYGTLITIENYETFQGERTPKRTPNGTANGTGDKNFKEFKEVGGKTPPSRAEVSKYVEEMGYGMDPDAFYDYYSETDWRKKNGQPIRDWKASVRTWERREKEFARKETVQDRPVIEPPKYKEFEPDAPIDAVEMPDDIRASVRRKLKEA